MSVDVSALEQTLRSWAVRAADELGEEFVRTAQQGVSRRSGKLHDSIEAERARPRSDGASVIVKVGEPYGVHQDRGTGIYGPDGRPITPRRPGGVLVFDWPAAGGVVFTRRVQGSEPTRFWQKAVEAWSDIVARKSA